MKPPPPKIPDAFLRALPQGISLVEHHGQGFLAVGSVRCPAGHELIDEDVRIHGQPSIRFAIDTGASRGRIYVDPFWGGHDKLYDFIPVATRTQPVLRASCPECGTSLIARRPCGVPGCTCEEAILLTLPDGRNRIWVCARLGCAGHHFEVADLPSVISTVLDDINYYTQDDDIFHGI